METLNFESAKLNITVYAGLDENGKQIKKKQTIHNISNTATASSLQAFAQAIVSLCDGDSYEAEITTVRQVL